MKIYTKILRICIYFISFFCIGLMLCIDKFFGKVTIEQVLSTFYFNLQGAFTADSIFIKRLFEWSLFWPAVLTLIVINLPILFFYFSQPIKKIFASKIIRHFFAAYFHFILLLICTVIVVKQFDVINYIKQQSQTSDDYFAKHYIAADQVNIKSNKTKNLLLIYVESLETSYSNIDLFRGDLLQQLTKINTPHISFNRYEQMPGTGWSIAGFVSTQCATPLKLLTIFNGNRTGEETKHFLGHATCLSDILAKKGYQNIFMNGPSLTFAGVNHFLKDHHYHEMIGKEEWIQKGILNSQTTTNWGLPDDMLFQQAKIKLAELVKAGKPFNLTLFTVDTHGVSGQLSKTCARQGYNNFQGIVECTANMLADLIHYCEKMGWLNNMDIVIVGDHLAMTNTVSHQLNQLNKRYIFNMIISQNKLIKNTDHVVHFDFLPTILTTLGFQIEGNRLGLGYTAIEPAQYSKNKNRFTEMKKEIPYRSTVYEKLW